MLPSGWHCVMSVEDHLGKDCRERTEVRYLGVWHRVCLTEETEVVVREEEQSQEFVIVWKPGE